MHTRCVSVVGWHSQTSHACVSRLLLHVPRLLCRSEPANKAFCLAVARWAFQDAGVLVMSNLRQHIIGSDVQPTLYRVNDEVEFLIDVQERNGDALTPYT